MNTTPDQPTLLIIGATGKTGIQVTKQALQRGYSTNVLVRSPQKLGQLESKVEVFQGDATDYEAVQAAVKNADIIISVLGPTKHSKPGMQPEATANITKAMKQHNKMRLISLTGAGVRTEGDNPKLADKAIRGVMQVVARKPLKDGEGHTEVIKSTDLDWTIVRAPMLTDNPGAGTYKVGMVGDDHMSTKISRQDLAVFILDCIHNDDMIHQLPMVSQ